MLQRLWTFDLMKEIVVTLHLSSLRLEDDLSSVDNELLKNEDVYVPFSLFCRLSTSEIR